MSTSRTITPELWNDMIDKLKARAENVGVAHGYDGLTYEHGRTDQEWPRITDWLEWQRHSGPEGVLGDSVAESLAGLNAQDLKYEQKRVARLREYADKLRLLLILGAGLNGKKVAEGAIAMAARGLEDGDLESQP